MDNPDLISLFEFLQGISTPVLLTIMYLLYRVMTALHALDKRVALLEYGLKEHHRMENTTDGNIKKDIRP